jgi:bile acid:Na+ symporter, BASS family
LNVKEIIGFALKASIMLTLFGFGLRSSHGDILYLLRRPRVLMLSLTAMFIIMPLFTVLMTEMGHFNPAVEIALIALSISPIPPLLPKKVTKAGEIAPYGLGLMVTAGTLAIVYIPLATYLIGKYFHIPFDMSSIAVAKVIALSVLLPLGVGVLFRDFSPALAARIAGPLLRVAGVVLLIGVLCILAFACRTAWALVGDGTIIAFVAFILVGLLVGHALGGPDPDSRVTLALSTACRHPALALAIAAANFPAERRVLGAILLYAVLNALLTAPYVSWQRKKIQEDAVPAPSY